MLFDSHDISQSDDLFCNKNRDHSQDDQNGGDGGYGGVDMSFEVEHVANGDGHGFCPEQKE